MSEPLGPGRNSGAPHQERPSTRLPQGLLTQLTCNTSRWYSTFPNSKRPRLKNNSTYVRFPVMLKKQFSSLDLGVEVSPTHRHFYFQNKQGTIKPSAILKKKSNVCMHPGTFSDRRICLLGQAEGGRGCTCLTKRYGLRKRRQILAIGHLNVREYE